MAHRARLASGDPALVLAIQHQGSAAAASPVRNTASRNSNQYYAWHNPAEPADACPAAWPGRPRAPLLISARTSPARSAPGWAHRLGSPVPPIETPLDPRHWQILVRLGRNKKLSADLGTLREHRQEVKSMDKMS